MSDAVKSHFDTFTGAQREALIATFDAFVRALPGGEVDIAWGMPSLRVGRAVVVSVSGFRDHNSVFPGPEVIVELAPKLERYTLTKGTIHFGRDKPLASSVVRAIAKSGVGVINARYPKKDGRFLEYYDNGFLKQAGSYRDGAMHGKWQWYRRDGSLMRSGEFSLGQQTGEWTTFDRMGARV